VRLDRHLETSYGLEVADTRALDRDVFLINLRDGGQWVARVFPPERPAGDVEADAALLRTLEDRGFPAERCACEQAATSCEGRGVLVTRFIPPAASLPPGRPAAVLGALLGRLHTHPGAGLREGGAWHRLSFTGGPRAEIDAAARLLEDALERVAGRELPLYDRLRDEVDASDDCTDLPHAFVHPDFVPANAIPTRDERLAIVDWTGAGRGPRLWSLGCLLWAAGVRSARLVELVVSRYRRSITPEPEELERLAGAIRARPLMLDCWSFCNGRLGLGETMQRVAETRERANWIAAVARREFAASS
jgi:aminoglycoside phosphotransferase (APT) family kinase protein